MSRFIDRGAVIAGWVGVGAAVVAVIALGLIVAIPPLVIIAALPLGALVGAYANVRANRQRPRRRVLANSLWAGAATALALAVFYVGIRLVFVYLDTGRLPDDRQLDCQRGPDCVYARLVEFGEGARLAEEGITDAATYEAAVLGGMQTLALVLLVGTVGGAALAGGAQALSGRPSGERSSDGRATEAVG